MHTKLFFFFAVLLVVSGAKEELCRTSSSAKTPINSVYNVCGSLGSSTIGDARNKAVDFAPYLHFHQLEKYYLTNPQEYLNQANIYNKNREKVGPATEENLLLLIQSTNGAKDYYLSAESIGADYRYGASFNRNDQSSASVFYNVFEAGDKSSWVYNYYFFYAYNGCSNQQLLTESEDEQTHYMLDYYACDMGVHEGDWEHISVEVCKNLSTVVRISYGQHGWNEQLNCLVGECNFEGDTQHPLVFSGLYTHASYAVSAFMNVYDQYDTSVLENVLAVSLLDRTLSYGDPPRRFVPSASNVVEIGRPEHSNVTHALQSYYRNSQDPGYVDFSEPTWISFRGRWGESYLEEPRRVNSIRCLFNNQTQERACQNLLVITAEAVLGEIQDVGSIPDGDVQSEVDDVLSAPGPRGPNMKDYYDEWEAPIPTPMEEQGKTLVCPDKSKVSYDSTYGFMEASDYSDAGLQSAISSSVLLCFVMGFLVVNLVLRKFRPDLVGRSSFGLLLVAAQSIPTMSVVGTVSVVVGWIVLQDGLFDVYSALREHVPAQYVDKANDYMTAVPPIVVFVDALAIISGVCSTGGFSLALSHHPTFLKHLRRYGCKMEIVLGVLLIIATSLTVVVFGIGLMATVVHFVFSEACDFSADNVQGICINFTDLGWDFVLCGEDLRMFCNDWKEVDPSQIMVGAYFTTLGQMIFLVACGYNYTKYMRMEEVPSFAHAEQYKAGRKPEQPTVSLI